MKNILLIAFLILSNMIYTQNKYEIDLKEAKDYVDNVFRKDSSRIENYVKLSDGRIMRSNTDNPIEEFDNDWNRFYKILRKNDKIIFISKSPDMWGGIGDSSRDYNYYFNNDSVLVGAEKKLEFFIKDRNCAEVVKYVATYLNDNKPKLLKVESIKDYNGKLIKLDSPKCRNSKKDIFESIEDLDRINFRDVEGFMKAEKIKYYK